MTKNGRERRLMEREMKSGRVLHRRFIKAVDRVERRTQLGRLEEVVVSRYGIRWLAIRKPRPSLIHKGGKP